MAMKLYEETDIQNIANSIRGKNGETTTYKVSEMSSAIDAIETGSGSSSARLPSEYQEVEYIESTGTQYIDTQYAVTNNLRVKTKFKFTGKYNTDGGFVFGARETISKKCFWLGTGWSWQNYSFGYGNGYSRISNMSTDINNIYEIETAGSQLYFNGDEAVADMIEGNLNTSTGTGYNIYLFDRNNAGTRASGTKLIIYYFKLFKDDILVRDMIPCYRISDNEIGLYDLANNVFYENQGTGEFVKGNPTIPTIEITEDGMHTITGYDLADVKVLDSLTETLKITSNDIYDVKNYANVNVVVPSTGEWTPEEDWWDIDSILENDTSGYQGSVICLLRDSLVSTSIEPMGAAKIITSDCGEYTSPSAVITHTWDTTKDKECSLGYKTRYVIWLYDTTTFPNNYNKYFPQETIYSVFNMRTNNLNFNSYQNLRLLEAIKFIDFTTSSGLTFMSNLNSLKKIWGLKVAGNVSLSGVGIFSGCTSIEKTEDLGTTFKDGWAHSVRNCFSGMYNLKSFHFSKLNLDPSLLTSYWTLFQNNYSMKYIDKIDFTSLNTSNVNDYYLMFNNCCSLVDIGSIGTIPMSGLNLTTCYNLSHETLLKFLNALYDYAAEGSTDTYTLTLGTTNLAKLTDEEKAIATNKGWTLA